MTDYLEEYLRDAAPLVSEEYRVLQRNAFQEVIQLSSETVAPVIAQIESLYTKAQKIAAGQLEETQKEIESRIQDRSEELESSHTKRLLEIQTLYDKELKRLDRDAKSSHNAVISRAEGKLREVKRKCEEDILLGETDRDAAIQNARRERAHIEKAVPAGVERLDEMTERAERILELYRYPVPASAEDSGKAVPDDTPALENPDTIFRDQLKSSRQSLDRLGDLSIPRMFIGSRPFVYIVFICGLGVGVAWLLEQLSLWSLPSFPITGPIAFVVMLGLALWIGRFLWKKSRAQIRSVYDPFRDSVASAHRSLQQCLEQTLAQVEQQIQDAKEKYHNEAQAAKDHFQTVRSEVEGQRGPALQKIESTYAQKRQALEQQTETDSQQEEEEYQKTSEALQQEHDQETEQLRSRCQGETSHSRAQYESSFGRLQDRWRGGLASIETMLKHTASLDSHLLLDWRHSFWRQWEITESFTPMIRFGQFQLSCTPLAVGVRDLMDPDLCTDAPIPVPAFLAFPDNGSLLLQTQREGRDQAIGALRAVMLRLLTSQPPGRVHFTIIDPVGLGENFAGFMHATDYEETLVGRRIWTDASQIQQRLIDLTEHMENVIQKYLRNEFETIEEYNQQAGELAEPYRFLVIADFPTNCNEESAKRLLSIINSGARCGVYTLIAYDARQDLPSGMDIDDLSSGSVYLKYKDNRFVWQDSIYKQFSLEVDLPPSEELLTSIMHTVGRAAIDSTRVEVPFAVIAPEEGKYWSESTRDEIHVPVGRCGANRLQTLKLGKGVAQHVLIAGKTGSGKSTLLHVIITNLALWYSPDEIELYLIDFKRGVEFKTYVTHRLAHARAVAIESDREFGLSILKRLDAEMARRGEMFRKAGVQDVGSYRQASGETLPRTILIVDEFQVYFSEDDKLAQDAAVLLEQLVRQGRAFGIHVLLGSQTLGGASGLARSTMGQMAVRIALQCSEADSQLILDDDNLAARLLSRPGEAIYNDSSGMLIGNSPFQTSWLPDEERDVYLERIAQLHGEHAETREPMIVFEGNIPADINDNRFLSHLLAEPNWPAPIPVPRAWLGEPVAIKDPTAVLFRRQSGANLIIVGQREEAAQGLMSAAMIGLASQYEPNTAKFYILDGSPVDSPRAGYFEQVRTALPHESHIVEWRDVPTVITELATETQRRLQEDHLDAPAIYVLIYSLQRYRMLRRDEDDFSFSLDAEAPPKPGKQFADVLRDGPSMGIHVLVWSDTLATIERTLDRQSVREFDYRVLFQMSAADSSNLIDSPVANQLGYHRALFHSEEKGILEKFRPYAPVEADFLNRIKSQFAAKT
jgi:DNA segregation ATPase FtsK/SpoIIIE, S-DNA-T family